MGKAREMRSLEQKARGGGRGCLVTFRFMNTVWYFREVMRKLISRV